MARSASVGRRCIWRSIPGASASIAREAGQRRRSDGRCSPCRRCSGGDGGQCRLGFSRSRLHRRGCKPSSPRRRNFTACPQAVGCQRGITLLLRQWVWKIVCSGDALSQTRERLRALRRNTCGLSPHRCFRYMLRHAEALIGMHNTLE